MGKRQPNRTRSLPHQERDRKVGSAFADHNPLRMKAQNTQIDSIHPVLDIGNSMASDEKTFILSDDASSLVLVSFVGSTLAGYLWLYVEVLGFALPYLRQFYVNELTPYCNVLIAGSTGLVLGMLGGVGGVVAMSVAFGVCLRIFGRWMTEVFVSKIVDKVQRTRIPLFGPIFYCIFPYRTR